MTLRKRLCDDGRIYGISKVFAKFLLIFREISLCKFEDKMRTWGHDLPSAVSLICPLDFFPLHFSYLVQKSISPVPPPFLNNKYLQVSLPRGSLL